MLINRGLLIVAYALSTLMGLMTTFFPVTAIIDVLTLHLTVGYGILILAGSIGALVSVVKPDYRLEIIFLWLIIAGYMCYDVALWGLFAERVGIIDGLAPPYGPALTVLVLVVLLFAKQMTLIKKNKQLVGQSNGLA